MRGSRLYTTSLLALCLTCLCGPSQAGFHLPGHVHVMQLFDKALAEARRRHKPLAFVYTDTETSCGLATRASMNLFERLEGKCVLVYVDSLSHPKVPGLVRKAVRSPKAGRYIPKAVVLSTNLSKVLAIIPYARGPAHVRLIDQALDEIRRGSPMDRDADEPEARAQVGEIDLRMRWKGDLKPMPLLVAARFLQRGGYRAEQRPGEMGQCQFIVRTEDSCERFSEMIGQYLQSRYRIESATCKAGKLEIQLAGIETPH